MKFAKHFALFAPALLLASCSADDIQQSGNTLTEDMQSYLKIAISQPGSALTRAEDPEFDDGEKTERDIDNIQFVFYSETGEPIYKKNVDFRNVTWDEVKPENSNTSDEKEHIIAVNLKAGTEIPHSVIAFVNMLNIDDNSLMEPTLEHNDQHVRQEFLNNQSNFSMTNSVYVDSENKEYKAVPVTPEMFKPTYDLAKSDENKDVLHIYLERLAAKVTVNNIETSNIQAVEMAGEDEDGKKVEKAYKLTFEPDGWGLTAMEKSEYLLKQINPAGYTDNIFDAQNKTSKTDTWTLADWNDTKNYRSYWAQSINYKYTEVSGSGNSSTYASTMYPQVADDLLEANPNDYVLSYPSFSLIDKKSQRSTAADNDFVTQNDIYPSYGNGFGSALYTFESTRDQATLNSKYRNSAVTSAVIAGHYMLEANSGTQAHAVPTITAGSTPAYNTFYIYDDKLFPSGEIMLEKFASLQTIVYRQNTSDKSVTKLDDADLATVFEIKHPSSDVRTPGFKVSEAYVTLQVKSNPSLATTSNNYQLVTQIEGEWVRLDNSSNTTPAQRNYANQRLNEQLGQAEMYNEGAAYFGVLIKHIRPINKAVDHGDGSYQNPDGSTTGSEANHDTEIDYMQGNYGLVRNHSYQITINSITGRASGVCDPDSPIVLPTESTRYYVQAQMHILSWRVIKNDKVELNKPVIE